MACALLAMAVSLQSSAQSTDESSPGIDDARAKLAEWVDVRRIISKEKRDWALAKELLNERIELVQREIDSLNDKIADAEKSITEADKKRQELIEENDKFKEVSSSLDQAATTLEKRTLALLPRLPRPISDRVKPLSQRIPADSAKSELSLSQRFQNVVGILNEVNKFHREITLTTEVRTLEDGSSSEVTTLYLGVSRGYYVNTNRTVAGTGTSGPDGWVWTPANDAAERIASAIAILNNEEVASYVMLPVEAP